MPSDGNIRISYNIPTDRNFASASHYRIHDGNKYMTFSSQVELEHYAELVLHRLNPSKR